MQRYEPVRPKVRFPEAGYGSRPHFRVLRCRIQGSKQRIRQAEKDLAGPNRQIEDISSSLHDLARLQKHYAQLDLNKAKSETLQAVEMNKSNAELAQLKSNPEWLVGG